MVLYADIDAKCFSHYRKHIFDHCSSGIFDIADFREVTCYLREDSAGNIKMLQHGQGWEVLGDKNNYALKHHIEGMNIFMYPTVSIDNDIVMDLAKGIMWISILSRKILRKVMMLMMMLVRSMLITLYNIKFIFEIISIN